MAVEIGIMHIGKTGGTAIREALRPHITPKDTNRIKLFAHQWTLKKIVNEDAAEKIVFIIREPTDRFVSAFNSRLRQGLPRHWSPWSRREKIAFGRFKKPNQLAEALNSWNPFRRRAARKAMTAIKHCRLAYEFYLNSVHLLEKEKQRIFFIGEQENLTGDFEILKRLLNVDKDLALPSDDVKSHKSPENLDTRLSKRARRNLRKYYSGDYEIYNWCKAHKQALALQHQTHPVDGSQVPVQPVDGPVS